MEKFAVDESGQVPESLEKVAEKAGKCPKCGSEVERHGRILICPNCGSEPYEAETK